MLLGEVPDGPDTDVHPLHRAEGPLHLRQALAGDDRILRREHFLFHVGTENVDPIQIACTTLGSNWELHRDPNVQWDPFGQY